MEEKGDSKFVPKFSSDSQEAISVAVRSFIICCTVVARALMIISSIHIDLLSAKLFSNAVSVITVPVSVSKSEFFRLFVALL